MRGDQLFGGAHCLNRFHRFDQRASNWLKYFRAGHLWTVSRSVMKAMRGCYSKQSIACFEHELELADRTLDCRRQTRETSEGSLQQRDKIRTAHHGSP